MDMPRLLIADASAEVRDTLAEAMKSRFRVCTASDGPGALEALRQFLPDVLLLDMLLPGLDGVGLLERAETISLRPGILTTTRFVSPYILSRAQEMGVDYMMVKPCDVDSTVQRLEDLARQRRTPLFCAPEPRTEISNVLIALGMQTKRIGYGAAREAVLLLAAGEASGAVHHQGTVPRGGRQIRNQRAAGGARHPHGHRRDMEAG